MTLVYLRHDHGGTIGTTSTPYNTVDEALEQAVHDAANGFGIPLSIDDGKGKTLVSKAEIAAKAVAR